MTLLGRLLPLNFLLPKNWIMRLSDGSSGGACCLGSFLEIKCQLRFATIDWNTNTPWNYETVRLFDVRKSIVRTYLMGVRRSARLFGYVCWQFDIRPYIFDNVVSSSIYYNCSFWNIRLFVCIGPCGRHQKVKDLLFSVTCWTMFGPCEASILVKSVTQQFSTSDGSGIVSDEALELELWTFFWLGQAIRLSRTNDTQNISSRRNINHYSHWSSCNVRRNIRHNPINISYLGIEFFGWGKRLQI